jgi:hypothetical protein
MRFRITQVSATRLPQVRRDRQQLVDEERHRRILSGGVTPESKHIGFRVGDPLAALIDGACGEGAASRSGIVHEAIRRGLQLLASDTRPTISSMAVAAGRHQLRVSLTDEDNARLEALQVRITDAAGRPAVRVFVLRECLVRGLESVGHGAVAEAGTRS